MANNVTTSIIQVIFWPDTILGIFSRFGVKQVFDLLSVDTDSHDFFMIETILDDGYRPRVIITEINKMFDITEAKTILPPKKGKFLPENKNYFFLPYMHSGDILL